MNVSMNVLPPFKKNSFFTMGVELELQLVDLQHFNLAMEAQDFLRRLSEVRHTGEIKPEITLSMIEINSSVHTNYDSLLTELSAIKELVRKQAAQTHIGICGGGAHPFQKWNEQRIFPIERFANVSEQYGYLAKQFTVFGQHIHIGCENGDDALYLCHAMARYLPQFIVLSSASPFHQGVDTKFDCSRLTAISSFPLSGTPPWVHTWSEFESYFENMSDLGIVKSMKDFYWDIRPKPEYGTVEIRICDTPLTIHKAATLAAYAQMLASWLLETRNDISPDVYLTYFYNRFNASRYGFDAIVIDPIERKQTSLVEDIVKTCHQLEKYASSLHSEQALGQIKEAIHTRENGSNWIRKHYDKHQSLTDMVRSQVKLWSQ
jgi:glutamate---cysteine ligase / carboxylate-amine ligase